VNGKIVSEPQRRIYELIEKWGSAELNYPEDKYSIDIVLSIDSVLLAIEYDCYFWHDKNTQRRDKKKRSLLRKLGYRTLRIKAGGMVPDLEDLDFAILQLWNGERTWSEIVLDDWIPTNTPTLH